MFTPIDTALGAILLYQGSSGLLQHNGRVFGISSLLSGSVANPTRDNLPIIGGLVSSIIPVYYFAPSLLPTYPPLGSSVEAALATLATGFAVGWGTKVCKQLISEKKHAFPLRGRGRRADMK